MTDREALTAALETGTAFGWRTHREFAPLMQAGDERLAQLPEKCGTCGGTGEVGWEHEGPAKEQWDQLICPTCHGSGKAYPADRIERVERALIAAGYFVGYKAAAVAVLDALNGETP